jgi:hypothetical protein
VKLLLEIVGIVIHFNQAKDIQNMFEKPPCLGSFGFGVGILRDQKDNPHQLAIEQTQGQEEEEQNQFVYLKPQDLKGFGQILRKLSGDHGCLR